jgi:hypothetical protein
LTHANAILLKFRCETTFPWNWGKADHKFRAEGSQWSASLT